MTKILSGYNSYLEKDLSKVERYKNQAPSMIENNMDLNGRRVYAYYLYGKEADTDKILEVIVEGLAVAQEYQCPEIFLWRQSCCSI